MRYEPERWVYQDATVLSPEKWVNTREQVENVAPSRAYSEWGSYRNPSEKAVVSDLELPVVVMEAEHVAAVLPIVFNSMV
ncbi:MAG TPA: hypothetical protein PKI11_04260 [Candidatus Hydrogenedentes bacterium]|nr:hypothetical protein [Candidatus Hydrogenedentota bacterium]